MNEMNVSVEMIKRMIKAEQDKNNNKNYDEIPIRQPDGSVIIYRF